MQFDSYIVSDTKTAFSVPIFDKTNIKIKNNKSFKRFAFTLAETLITLTIIGVVAALTIPTLLNKYTKHTYVVGLKKAYAQLQHAVKMIPITEGCSAGDYDCAGVFQDWGKVTNIDGQDFGGNPNKKRTYLLSKQIKNSGLKKQIDVYNDTGYELNQSNTVDEFFIANDGIIYGFHFTGELLYIDINGTKGPNKMGRDQFIFELASETKNGVQQGTILPSGSKLAATFYNVPNGDWRNTNDCTTQNVEKRQGGGVNCTGRVLEEDAMNY